MFGCGKGGKGFGKGGVKCYRKVLRDNIQGIIKFVICCFVCRGGVKCIFGFIYEEICGVLKVFFENVICDVVIYIEYVKRKIVIVMDVVYVLKRQGCIFYGFGGQIINCFCVICIG